MAKDKSYEELMQQIAALQEQADQIIAAERGEALEQAKSLVAKFKFTAKELGIAPEVIATEGGKVRKQRAPVEMKYRSLEDSNLQWSGRGRQPRWVQDYIAQGGNLEDLVIG